MITRSWAHGKRKVTPSLLSSIRLALSWPHLYCVPDTLMLRRALLVTAPIVRCVPLDAGSWVRWAFVFHSPHYLRTFANDSPHGARHGGRVSNTLAGLSLCVLLASRAIA
jgi:hypothetical protein